MKWFFRRILGDRRKAERKDAMIPVDLETRGGHINLFLRTANISKGGAFIETDQPLPVGSEIGLTLAIPNLEGGPLAQPYKVTCRAVITHTQDNNRHGPRGMGVQFLDLSEEDWRIIDDFIRNLRSGRKVTSIPLSVQLPQLKNMPLPGEKVEEITHARSELSHEFEQLSGTGEEEESGS